MKDGCVQRRKEYLEEKGDDGNNKWSTEARG
jgi:hypothetical protein